MKIKNLYVYIFVFPLMMILFPVFLSAEVISSFDQPDTGYVSNVVVDIIGDSVGVWFATGEGLNFSFDNGQTWLSYDSSNGLVSNNISAIYSIPTVSGQRIWIASNHDQRVSGELMAISDGLSYSDDNGNTWKQINFDSLNIPYVWGGDRSIFDITGHFDPAQPGDNWLFFTAFAGGFLASRDGGMSWRRIYPSASDSIQFNTSTEPPSLRNRYFSCVADTSHGDSLFVWAGTAAGFFQYIFATPREKPFSKRINTIVFCNNCSGGNSNYVYFGGNKGFTRGLATGAPFISRFESDGLPGLFITAMIDFGGKLLVGTEDTIFHNSTGLAVSTDFGDSFSPLSSFTEVVGQNRTVSDFAVIRNRLYLAAEEAGLFVSNDSGNTWNKIYVDSSDTSTANRRNVVYALNAWDDTLRVGTDSGLVQLYLDPSGHIDSSRFFVFGEGAFSSTKVIRVKTQVFDSTDVIWTINRPVTDTGTAMVGRSADGGI
ncbi:MAG: hypothetical protein GXO93_04910, partial [FCB group bacterium]|nr:hypothetical protein [FCB group bacterium]